MNQPTRARLGELRRVGKWVSLCACITCGVVNQTTGMMQHAWFHGFTALALVASCTLWWPDLREYWRHRRRFPKGHCQTCGYDLTGNTSGVCPECGGVIQSEKGGRS